MLLVAGFSGPHVSKNRRVWPPSSLLKHLFHHRQVVRDPDLFPDFLSFLHTIPTFPIPIPSPSPYPLPLLQPKKSPKTPILFPLFKKRNRKGIGHRTSSWAHACESRRSSYLVYTLNTKRRKSGTIILMKKVFYLF